MHARSKRRRSPTLLPASAFCLSSVILDDKRYFELAADSNNKTEARKLKCSCFLQLRSIVRGSFSNSSALFALLYSLCPSAALPETFFKVPLDFIPTQRCRASPDSYLCVSATPRELAFSVEQLGVQEKIPQRRRDAEARIPQSRRGVIPRGVTETQRRREREKRLPFQTAFNESDLSTFFTPRTTFRSRSRRSRSGFRT